MTVRSNETEFIPNAAVEAKICIVLGVVAKNCRKLPKTVTGFVMLVYLSVCRYATTRFPLARSS
jgi:hypothetical protein